MLIPTCFHDMPNGNGAPGARPASGKASALKGGGGVLTKTESASARMMADDMQISINKNGIDKELGPKGAIAATVDFYHRSVENGDESAARVAKRTLELVGHADKIDSLKGKTQPKGKAPRSLSPEAAKEVARRGDISPAKYAKNSFAVAIKGHYHSKRHLLEEAGGRYSGRENVFILSPAQVEKYLRAEKDLKARYPDSVW